MFDVSTAIFTYDPAKDDENFRKHGLRLQDFAQFDTLVALVADTRGNYGERRFRIFGRIAEKAYMIVVTERDEAVRLISFRRVHEKEMRRYEQRTDR